jgi:hypothetical protein
MLRGFVRGWSTLAVRMRSAAQARKYQNASKFENPVILDQLCLS